MNVSSLASSNVFPYGYSPTVSSPSHSPQSGTTTNRKRGRSTRTFSTIETIKAGQRYVWHPVESKTCSCPSSAANGEGNNICPPASAAAPTQPHQAMAQCHLTSRPDLTAATVRIVYRRSLGPAYAKIPVEPRPPSAASSHAAARLMAFAKRAYVMSSKPSDRCADRGMDAYTRWGVSRAASSMRTGMSLFPKLIFAVLWAIVNGRTGFSGWKGEKRPPRAEGLQLLRVTRGPHICR